MDGTQPRCTWHSSKPIGDNGGQSWSNPKILLFAQSRFRKTIDGICLPLISQQWYPIIACWSCLGKSFLSPKRALLLQDWPPWSTWGLWKRVTQCLNKPEALSGLEGDLDTLIKPAKELEASVRELNTLTKIYGVLGGFESDSYILTDSLGALRGWYETFTLLKGSLELWKPNWKVLTL